MSLQKNAKSRYTKGVVLPNDAFQDMHSLRVEKLLEEFIRYNLFFMVLEGFLHFFTAERFTRQLFFGHPDLCKFFSILQALPKCPNHPRRPS